MWATLQVGGCGSVLLLLRRVDPTKPCPLHPGICRRGWGARPMGHGVFITCYGGFRKEKVENP